LNNNFLHTLTRSFIDSKITPLIIIASLLLGFFAIMFTPSEEEPQIIVPMVDIMVSMDGATSKEVEKRVVTPMEKLIWEIPGVEYVYSTAMPGKAITIVRFYVGENVEDSLIKVYDKLYSHFDWIPPGCSKPLLKPRSIDDVPIMAITLTGEKYDCQTIRKIASQLQEEINAIPNISQTELKGGLKREARISLRNNDLNQLGLDSQDVINVIRTHNQASLITELSINNENISVKFDNFFKNINDLQNLVINVVDGRPIYLNQIADISDIANEPSEYVFFGAGAAHEHKSIALNTGETLPAVTVAISKRKGTNATELTKQVMEKLEMLKGHLIPWDVNINITRDYGDTAKHKSDELLEHLFLATISVAILMAILLGVRSSFVVLVAIPVTLAFTLFIYFLYGYTLNRVTLFALIFCIGILVDDPIVGVENIVRHAGLPQNRNRNFKDVITEAIVEVGSPLVLATFTVIAAILPLAFVSGLMGPYMRPMPVGASVAMLISMIISFVITPWTAFHFLKKNQKHEEEKEGWFTRLYRWLMEHLIGNVFWRWTFLGIMALCFIISCSLIYFNIVKVKMLPFDNKSEFQVIIDMPEGTSLEQTAHVGQELGLELATQPEVTDYQIYVGTSSPYNFNGLVRHYFLRSGANEADIQVNLLPKNMRKEQSHPIAKRIRPELEKIAKKHGARIKVSEIPPGPPVLQTLVAEVYGPDYDGQINVAKDIMKIFEKTEGVVDVDWYGVDLQKEWKISVERDKAAKLGITPQRVMEVLNTSLFGTNAGLFHISEENEDVPIFVHTSIKDRTSIEDIQNIKVRANNGTLVSIAEVVNIKESIIDYPIYHKNLQPVMYVTADVAGDEESPVYAILNLNKKLNEYSSPSGTKLNLLYTTQPFTTKEWTMKWDGEWHITYEVFRDMGAAFAIVVVLIFILVVGWFRSYSIPLVILSPIPLSLIGIIPAHAIMGAFFTATSMIGFIAGAGIVVRNSIILVDFIELRLKEGMTLKEAVIDAGAVRFRPMLLTSSAVVVGSFVILFDPIFQGLAIALMAGEVAATLFSRMVVPILYYLDNRMKVEKRIVF